MEKTLKAVLAVNVRALMDARAWSEARVAEAGKIGTGSVWRVLHLQNVNLETLGSLARAFKLPAWALLVSELNPAATPVFGTQETLEARAQELAETLVREALDERRRLRQKAPARRRGDQPVAVSSSAEEKPPSTRK